MKSKEEIEEALRIYRLHPNKPDTITNRERRRALLWVLDQENESEKLEYENASIPSVLR